MHYFVDEIGEYGLNNTRRMDGVCDLDSCNVLIDNKLGNFSDE